MSGAYLWANLLAVTWINKEASAWARVLADGACARPVASGTLCIIEKLANEGAHSIRGATRGARITRAVPAKR